jgi:hypothetical protein
MNRRTFLSIVAGASSNNYTKYGSTLGVSIAVAATILFQAGARLVLREGKAVLDQHTHPYLPQTTEKENKLLEAITQESSAVALAGIVRPIGYTVFSFEELISLGQRRDDLKIELFCPSYARITWKRDDEVKTGNIYRAQETTVIGGHHLLLLGLEGDYIEDGLEADKAVFQAQKQKAVVTLNHPFILPAPRFPINYASASADLTEKIYELARKCDEVEAWNGQAVDVPFSRMANDNIRARKLVDDLGYAGIAASDAHTYSEILRSGIIFDSKLLDEPEKLKDKIRAHKFESSGSNSSIAEIVSGRYFQR